MKSDVQQIKFWTVLAMIVLGTAVVITLIDLGIKTAILEASGKFQDLLRTAEDNGQGSKGPGQGGDNPDNRDSGNMRGALLAADDARMEAADVRGGTGAPSPVPSWHRAGNTRMDNPGTQEIQAGDK